MTCRNCGKEVVQAPHVKGLWMHKNGMYYCYHLNHGLAVEVRK